MPVTNGHVKWVNGNLIVYSTHRSRWVDAYGSNVVKWEFPSAYDASEFNTTITSAGASAYITGTTGGAYKVKLYTKNADAKYAMMQAKTFPFKLENSMPLYFGCKVKINSATSTDFIAGLLVNKSGTILAAHNIAASIDGVYFLKKDTLTAITPTCESGGNTSTTSTTTMGTSAHILEFYWNGSPSSGAVDFYASGTLLGTVTSKIDQTADLGFSLGIGAGKVAHQTLSVEWARIIQTRV